MTTPSSPPERSVYSIAADIVDTKEEVDSLIAAYARSVQAARERAAMRSAARYLVGAGSSDRPGIIAAVCRRLASLDFNIEQARTVVAARCSLFHTLAAAPPGSEGDILATGVRLKAALEETPFGDRVGGFAYVDPLPPGAPPLLFDHARTCYVMVDVPQQDGVLSDLTRAVADNGGAILSLSSWLEEVLGDRMRVVDMRLAVPQDRGRVLQDRLASVAGRLRGRVSFTYELPTEPKRRPASTSVGPDNIVALTVSGHARPGFVFRVLQEVGDLSVVVSSMVVLDAYSLLIIMVDASLLQESADSLKERLEHRLSTWGRECGEAIPFTVHATGLATRRAAGGWVGPPTHRVRYSGAPDEEGIVADIADVFAYRGINIVWLDATIKPPISDDPTPFDVRAEISVPATQDEDDVKHEAEALAEGHGWECSFERVVNEATAGV